jgi:hypothetical protein
MVEDGVVKPYTKEDIEAIKKRPNQYSFEITFYDESARPDFPIVDENGTWLNPPSPPKPGS